MACLNDVLFPIRKRSDRGSALISALALVAITALLVSGICIFVTSHATRQRREGDYALAMQLAEAGINYELRYIDTTGNAHLSGSTYSGGVPGVAGTFSVYVRNTDGTANWARPKPAQIVSTGTVGGIARTVTANCKGGGVSIFDADFVVFGYQSVFMTGNGDANGGDIGTNGEMRLTGNAGTDSHVILAGPGATLTKAGKLPDSAFIRQPKIVDWPTIDTIVSDTFGGWSGLSSATAISSQFGRMRQFVGNSSSALTPANTTFAATVSGVNATNMGVIQDAQRQDTLILTPGDYFFTSIDFNKGTIVLDTASQTISGGRPGQIRIWVNGTGSDSFAGNTQFTSTDPSLFRLFYNKPAEISLTGNADFAGAIYAVRAGSSSAITPGSVKLAGNGTVGIMVIADSVTIHGNGTVGRPRTSIANVADYQTGGNFYGFSDTWQEVMAPGSGAVFPDGTNR